MSTATDVVNTFNYRVLSQELTRQGVSSRQINSTILRDLILEHAERHPADYTEVDMLLQHIAALAETMEYDMVSVQEFRELEEQLDHTEEELTEYELKNDSLQEQLNDAQNQINTLLKESETP